MNRNTDSDHFHSFGSTTSTIVNRLNSTGTISNTTHITASTYNSTSTIVSNSTDTITNTTHITA